MARHTCVSLVSGCGHLVAPGFSSTRSAGPSSQRLSPEGAASKQTERPRSKEPGKQFVVSSRDKRLSTSGFVTSGLFVAGRVRFCVSILLCVRLAPGLRFGTFGPRNLVQNWACSIYVCRLAHFAPSLSQGRSGATSPLSSRTRKSNTAIVLLLSTRSGVFLFGS